jgi:hypothetical protein
MFKNPLKTKHFGSRNENVLKLPRHGVYDILKVKTQKKVGVTGLVQKI